MNKERVFCGGGGGYNSTESESHYWWISQVLNCKSSILDSSKTNILLVYLTTHVKCSFISNRHNYFQNAAAFGRKSQRALSYKILWHLQYLHLVWNHFQFLSQIFPDTGLWNLHFTTHPPCWFHLTLLHILANFINDICRYTWLSWFWNFVQTACSFKCFKPIINGFSGWSFFFPNCVWKWCHKMTDSVLLYSLKNTKHFLHCRCSHFYWLFTWHT